MVLAVVTEIRLLLEAVEPDPFMDPPAGDPAIDDAAADTGVTGTDERVLTRSSDR